MTVTEQTPGSTAGGQLDPNEALMQFLYRAPIGLLQIQADGVIEMINPMSARLLMPLSSNGSLDNLFDVLGTVAPQLRQMVLAFNEASGSICDAMRVETPASGDDNRPLQVLSVSLLKLDESRLMAMVNDVTSEALREQSVLNARLGEAARLDKVTRMPNRTSLREFVERAIERQGEDPSRQFSVLFMNCDRFRQINDSLGHAAGDQVLAQIARRLQTIVHPSDGEDFGRGSERMAGRLGSDEFVVVLCDANSESGVCAVAQNILDALSLPYRVQDRESRLSVSMGIVLVAASNQDADTVLQEASIAMVEAKRSGGARFVRFEPSMHERAARRGELENDLHRAIVERQFFVVYQPVVALQQAGDEACRPPYSAGVEALVRWHHPVRGVVPPVEFVGVAEECGAIGALGEFVLSTACHQFVAWQTELGRTAPRLLAVNLSRAQLNDDGFVAMVSRLLKQSGMPPRQLQLEVTESLAAQDESVRAKLRELKALGITLALDDFGTGYSSLSSLHQLPVDTVKIDRSFVCEAVTSPHHRVLIEATVRVAASLSMGTVAEGVETDAQANVVRSLGCEKGQGYLFSKPLRAEDLAAWLSNSDQ
ncbi:bifunctional diguanylate cyclase/phosphodiesterase [Paraburkholderia sp. PREW-6R]|uniref:putative bifunctional diguanylate cyclase/phosphodiesterase n=1 Tax=Paraburkholderia sp. PREW-6R TaxID=3141544 RepID=UPI0031F5A793